jgi:hypothetical protein
MCELEKVTAKLENGSEIVAEVTVRNRHVKILIKMYFCLLLQIPHFSFYTLLFCIMRDIEIDISNT